MLVIRLQCWAQEFDDDESFQPDKQNTDDTDLTQLLDEEYQEIPFQISFSQILTIIALLAVCYVFGKIWKGCSYLIIIVALILFFMAH